MSALFFWAVFLAALGYLIYVGGKTYLRWLGGIVTGWFTGWDRESPKTPPS